MTQKEKLSEYKRKLELNYSYKLLNRDKILQERRLVKYEEDREKHKERMRIYREKNKKFEKLRLHLRDKYGITINKSMFKGDMNGLL